MPQFHLDPTARLQRYLGRELIGDPNLAIVEFVKNSYDAGASEVHVDFKLDGPVETHEIVISDNGVGMDVESFRENWTRPGYSYKVASASGETARPRTAAAERQRSRVPTGEKGLGRLAAGRLGERLEVYSRQSPDDPWLKVVFDWQAFDRMDIPMRKVPIHYELGVEPPLQRFPTGTVVRILAPLFNWSHRVRGRKVPGRPDTRLGRLRQDLGLLMEPFNPSGDDFRIFLGVDRPELTGLAGPITPGEPSVRDYVWKFEIAPHRDGVRIKRTIRRSPRVAALTEKPKHSRLAVLRRVTGGDADDGEHLRSGPFKGAFYYSPPQVAQRAEVLGIAPGVYLYRDGVRVDPYGSPGDDWLGVQARKASRQGYAAIQPNQLMGYVEISRTSNHDLIDMSNRNGLVENEAYEDLVGQLRAEFRAFDDVVLEEVVKPQWEQPTTVAQTAARRAQSFGVALSRAITHSLRQPVAGLGAELDVAEATSAGLPDGDAKERLTAMVERARGHLDDIDASLQRLISLEAVDAAAAIEEVDARNIVEQAVALVSAYSNSMRVPVVQESSGEVRVVTNAAALTKTTTRVIRNAIQATRDAGRTTPVSIQIERDDKTVEIQVVDNGRGVDESSQERLFENMFSTSGRPGFGLLGATELLALVNARIELRDTGANGSTFAIVLPTPSAARKKS